LETLNHFVWTERGIKAFSLFDGGVAMDYNISLRYKIAIFVGLL
jgi:hypothetical protein